MKGGLLVSLFISVVYLPLLFFNTEVITQHELGNFLQVSLFFFIGGLIGWMRDKEITFQEHQRKSESLAAMGKAVSCIAHDMRTPLIAISGFTSQVKKRLLEDDTICRKLDLILQQVDRLEMLVQDMLAFAKPLKLKCQNGSLNAFLEGLILIVQEKAQEHGVIITPQLTNKMPKILFDSNRMQQALLNLMSNAIEASPHGGEVIVRTEFMENSIVIEIVDQGEGITTICKDDIFTPFLTTKKEGTGLGLSIVKKVIEAHSGSISYFENGVCGLTFQITLPVISNEIN